MLQFLADENFNERITDALRRLTPTIDVAIARDVGLAGAPDKDVLIWAADRNRIILTHDAKTLVPEANERVRANLPMPGVFVVKRRVKIGVLAEEIALIAECSVAGEWDAQVRYLPIL